MNQDDERRHRGSAAAENAEARALTGRRGAGGRTFHCMVGSVTKAKPTGKGGSVDYLARLGDFKDRNDLEGEPVGRDPDEMKAALNAMHEQTTGRRGRVGIPVTLELPRELSAEGRRNVAEAAVAWFETKGHPAMAVVHGKGTAKDQPHIHLIATGRKAELIGGNWIVAAEGRKGAAEVGRLFRDKAALKEYRHTVAAMINTELRREGHAADWHGGNFKDVGIEREAKRRVPEGRYQQGQREIKPVMRQFSRACYEFERAEAARKREAREAEKARRQADRDREKRELQERAFEAELQAFYARDHAKHLQAEIDRKRAENEQEAEKAPSPRQGGESRTGGPRQTARPLNEHQRRMLNDVLIWKLGKEKAKASQHMLEDGGDPVVWGWKRDKDAEAKARKAAATTEQPASAFLQTSPEPKAEGKGTKTQGLSAADVLDMIEADEPKPINRKKDRGWEL